MRTTNYKCSNITAMVAATANNGQSKDANCDSFSVDIIDEATWWVILTILH